MITGGKEPRISHDIIFYSPFKLHAGISANIVSTNTPKQDNRKERLSRPHQGAIHKIFLVDLETGDLSLGRQFIRADRIVSTGILEIERDTHIFVLPKFHHTMGLRRTPTFAAVLTLLTTLFCQAQTRTWGPNYHRHRHHHRRPDARYDIQPSEPAMYLTPPPQLSNHYNRIRVCLTS